MPNRVVLLCLFGLWTTPYQASSQVSGAPDYILEAWHAEDGLPHSAINALIQSRDGYLWMGTGAGLVRFDGLRFTSVFSEEASPLANSYVWTLLEDDDGVLWIGSSNGLSRYDGRVFTTYTIDHGLPNNFVRSILHDSAGRLWVGTYGGGLCLFDRSEHICRRLPDGEGATDLFVNAIIEDHQGAIWVGTDTGLLQWVDGQWAPGIPDEPFQEQVKALLEDTRGRLWLGTSKGLFWRTDDGRLDRVPLSGESIQAVRSLFEDREGHVWIGTEVSGLYLYEDGRLRNFDTEAGLSHNYIWDIFQDQEGSLWVGTNGGGLNRLMVGRVRVYGIPEGLPDNTTHTILEDRDGAIWFGSNYGLSRLHNGTITLYTEADGLSYDRVFALAQDSDGRLWIGTNGGGLNRFHNNRFQPLTTEDGLLSDVVFSVFIDENEQIWVGTTRGVNRIAEGRIDSFTTADGLPPGFAVVIREGLEGDIWIGTDAGLARLRDGAFTTYTTEDGLPNDAIRALYLDAEGVLWIGTRGGLSRFRNGSFHSFTTEDGLPDNVIYHIAEDDAGHLWLNTGRSGIVRIAKHQLDEVSLGIIDAVSPFVLGRSDGMRSIEGIGGFQPAGLKDRHDRLWFLTHGGAVVLDPAHIAPDPYAMPVLIEEIFADNEPVFPDEGNITVPYNTNRLVIHYTGLSYLDPHRIMFRHRLDGLEEDWSYDSNERGPQRTREFTRLSPGAYTFRVNGANRDGIWSSQEATLRIVVPPPLWLTPLAFFVYVVLLGLSVYGIVRWRVLALELRTEALEELVDERTHQVSQQARRLEELDALKSQFFANISHEFRTPLTLILSSLEEIHERDAGGDLAHLTHPMERQGRQLLRLVNQLLDLSKIDAGAMEFQPAVANIEAFLRQLVASFTPLSERRGIALEFHSSTDRVFASFDPDKLQQVIDNLLSNAFKHTERGGKINVSLKTSDSSIDILVRDTGRGIEPEDLTYVFDRFYQGAPSHTPENGSSGIGLALAKELIEMHEGTIDVDSTPGFGTTFTLRLPHPAREEEEVNTPYAVDGAVAERSFFEEHEPAEAHEEAIIEDGAQTPTLLVVEDNAEVRSFISMCLQKQFRVEEVSSGSEALSSLDRECPDLILCDVMMPGMSGFELCRLVKEHPQFNHIPIILLTARASAESTEEGLRAGADDYITKPFSAKQLRLRIQNVIASRSVLREKYSRELVVKPADVAVESADESFLRQVMETVEKQMGEPNFNVDALAAELHMSRRQLQRKLRDVSDLSPSDFIRTMRLERAAQLLDKDAGTVSEIAYQVGFRKPSHFSELFRKKFGQSPTEYRT